MFSNSFHANLLKALMCKLFSLCGALCLKRLLLPHNFIFRLCGPLSWNGKKCILIFVFVLYFCFMSTDSRGMVILIIQCSVQRKWQGTVQSFYWKCFVLTDLNRPVFSGVVNSAVKGMGWKNEEKRKPTIAGFFLSPNVRLCCDTVSSDYTSLIGKDFSEGISNMKYL